MYVNKPQGDPRLLTLVVALIAGFLLSAAPARANYLDLINNGNFTETSLTNSGQISLMPGQLTDWWSSSPLTLSFLYYPGTTNAQLSDQFTAYGTNYFSIYQGVTNTIPSAPPGGGNFVAVDADPSFVGSLTQTVTGLTPGTQYTLSFYQAADQQTGYSGATTEQWQVTFGNQTILSAQMNNPSQGFTPWEQQSLTFTATNATQYLTFMALGSPDGLPPIVMLADVSLVDPPSGGPVAAPEPSTVGLFGFGLISFVFVGARLRKFRS